MLQNWLNPISTRKVNNFNKKPKTFIGNKLKAYEKELPNLKNAKIALIGIDENNAEPIRHALYHLSHNFAQMPIVDLGNIKKTTPSFLIPVLKELHDSNIIPIVFGAASSIVYAQYQAHYALKQLTNLIAIDERIAFDLDGKLEHNYLNKIINNRKLFHLGVLAYQAHFTPSTITKYFSNRNYEYVRLGQIRSQMDEVEPILRDADLLAFNIEAVRSSDAPGQQKASPNGLFGEEACQICRYAGMSDKVNSIGFYNYHLENDTNQLTAQLIAQMIWYFIDGVANRKKDFPISTDGLVEYIVHQKKLDHQITFWKSTRSGRWWMQIPVKTRKKHERHRLIPCSHQDYLAACDDELPERLLKAYERFV